MEIKLVYNKKASETIERLKAVACSMGISFVDKPNIPVLKYGISDFNLSKSEQAILFQDIIENTIIDNYRVIDDYSLVVMKNPTRVLLYKDAKRESGTKYFYIKNKEEWRINYSYGKVRAVLNKNISDNLFGKSSITQWTAETNPTIREVLIKLTKDIANVVEEMSDLKSFGLDIIKDKNSDTYYFLELNQANSLSESGCEFFLMGYLDYLNSQLSDEMKNQLQELVKYLNTSELQYLKELIN